MSRTLPPDRAALHVEDVVAHARFVRALARALARDPGDADELAAHAMAEAIARPPDAAPALRSWLRRVVWRLFLREQRDSERRLRREKSAARAEAQPATVDLVAQVELQRRIGEAFAALDEPFKSALFRRYFHDESPSSIARDSGTSVATVKSRLQRGLAQLRARLDAAHSGRREEWLAALVPWLSVGGPVVATNTKLVALGTAAVIVATASVAVLETGKRGAGDDAAPPPPAAAAIERDAANPPEERVSPRPEPIRAEIAEAERPPTLGELRRLLVSSRRLDQVRAIELLLAEGSAEAVRELVDRYLASQDPVLVALLEEALLDAAADAAPGLLEAMRATTDATKLGKVAALLVEIAARRPELEEAVIASFFERLADPGLEDAHEGALFHALVALGERALRPLADFLAEPGTDPRGMGTAAAALSRLDAAHADAVRDVVGTALESLRTTLARTDRSAADEDAARKKTGSLVWAAASRPTAEHDRLAGKLVEELLRTTDEPQAGTIAWGVGNLKGITDDARLDLARSILRAAPEQPAAALRQIQLRIVNQLVESGWDARPPDSRFHAILDAVEDAASRHHNDPEVSTQLERLLAELRAFEQERK